MKKLTLLLLSLMLFLLLFTACNNQASTEGTTESTSSAQTAEAPVTVGEINYGKIIVPLGQKGDKIPVNREDLIELLNSHIAIESPGNIRMYIPGHIEEERFLDMLNYSFYKHIEQYTYTDFLIYTEGLDVERFADALEQLTRYSDISRIVLREYPINPPA